MTQGEAGQNEPEENDADTDGSLGFNRASRVRLGPKTAHLFADDTLFHRVARVLSEASCVPRKELFESWEVARRARRRLRGGRVVDLACGHGLIAYLMLILDDSSPCALAVDRRLPKSARRVAEALSEAWPRLRGRVELSEARIDAVTLTSGDVVVAAHACGPLTDEVLGAAIAARARVAVLPCCHATGTGDVGGLGGWIDPALAMDVTRAARLRQHGYAVWTQTIPAAITEKNRLLLAAPMPPTRILSGP